MSDLPSNATGNCSAASGPETALSAATSGTPAVIGLSNRFGLSSRPCTRHPRPVTGKVKRRAPWTQTPTGQAWLRAEQARKEQAREGRAAARRLRLAQSVKRSVDANRDAWKAKTRTRSVGKVRRVSKVQAARNRRYAVIRNEFMARSENWNCAFSCCPNRATQVHHQRGKLGDLLFDTRFWHPVCGETHAWIDANREAARETIAARGTNRGLTLLCASGEFNTQPKE